MISGGTAKETLNNILSRATCEGKCGGEHLRRAGRKNTRLWVNEHDGLNVVRTRFIELQHHWSPHRELSRDSHPMPFSRHWMTPISVSRGKILRLARRERITGEEWYYVSSNKCKRNPFIGMCWRNERQSFLNVEQDKSTVVLQRVVF